MRYHNSNTSLVSECPIFKTFMPVPCRQTLIDIFVKGYLPVEGCSIVLMLGQR